MAPPQDLQTHYRYIQWSWWVWLVTPLGMFLIAVAVQDVPQPTAVISAALAIAACVLLFGCLSIEVNQQVLYVKFGIGLVSTRVELKDVAGTHVREHPFAQTGISWMGDGWLWSVSGREVVMVMLGCGRALYIGTNDSQGLREFIDGRLAARTQRGSRP